MATTDKTTAQLDRILTMTPNELVTQIRAEGRDPAAVAEAAQSRALRKES